MKINNEITIGIIVTLGVLALVTYLTGIYGILYIGLAFIVVIISLNLFSKKSLVAKTFAVILNTDLIYKILMPKRYKNEIKELKENSEKT